jgi:cyclopropane fatty-acyl-phospholipid synthase-like methyltransferase
MDEDMSRAMSSVDAYEKHAQKFLKIRDRSTIGKHVVEQWARTLSDGSNVIEIACGGGLPVTQILSQTNLNIWAIDASPTLVAEFKARFPTIPVKCELAQTSDYFGRKFNAAIAVGLIFLLSEADQIKVINRISQILLPQGRFLFTAPIEIGTWQDINTGHQCQSLGREQYRKVLSQSSFEIISNYEDKGGNNYYEVEKA